MSTQSNGSPIRFSRELITPQAAAELLARNSGNRSIMGRRVAAMVADMKNGDWRETHQAIALSADGTLKDGQHRLTAVVTSGLPQKFWIARGLPVEATDAIDRTAPRSISDMLTIGGHMVSRSEAAIGRRMMDGLSPVENFTRRQYMDGILRYWEAIHFVCGKELGRLRNASILAVCARAYYTCDHDRILQFLDCLRSGVVRADEDSAAVVLSRYYQANKKASGRMGTVELYAKACSALRAFLDHQPLSKLYAVDREIFLLPLADD